MNPLYEIYLKIHGIEAEPKVYNFIIWASVQSRKYKAENKIENIHNYNHFYEWVKLSHKQS
jgi:hypothetical protein